MSSEQDPQGPKIPGVKRTLWDVGKEVKRDLDEAQKGFEELSRIARKAAKKYGHEEPNDNTSSASSSPAKKSPSKR